MLSRAITTAFLAWLLTSCAGNNSSSGSSAGMTLRVMTFNTGTPACEESADARYSCAHAAIADEWYGNGLSFIAILEDTRVFFAATRPDIVGFQEIFHPGECPEIPPEYHTGFICENWQPGDPTVAQHVLGPDYQIACHPGRPDKCLAVRMGFGRIQGCGSAICLNHLDAGSVDGCGGGTRIARGLIEVADGSQLTVVNIHGTSGRSPNDQTCRVAQFDQVFVDILDGSGQPAANGDRNIVLGDLNTDPGRGAAIDPSARRWTDFVGTGRTFNQISDAGPLTEPTYANAFNIDHVASDAFVGNCFTGQPTQITAFDHMPIICDLSPFPP
ncbi:hypothetical protein PS2015_2759 [Pseudohongiella spirulinae]|uniref:Endonuclease/exonuclease/phosphatase domain-containing protein n=2 Tax=Pseudohongiella spirulinae TaxID=1249552 RepID=A0A0S2KHE4_9GAMM|nr:hypothetical protein PS2015_2759 [Pseudohongiella spirulinae]